MKKNITDIRSVLMYTIIQAIVLMGITHAGYAQFGVFGESQVCRGDVERYTISCSGASGFTWSVSGGSLQSSTSSSYADVLWNGTGTGIVSVSYSCGFPASESLSVSITDPYTAGGNISGSTGGTTCSGTGKTLDAGSGTIIEWQHFSSGSWQRIDGNTSSSRTFSPSSDTRYRVKKAGTGGCSSIYTREYLLDVVPVISHAGSVSPVSQSLCAGESPQQLVGTTPSGGTGSYSYLWQQSSDGSSWVTASGTNSQQNYTPPTQLPYNTTYYRRRVKSTNCTAVYSASVQVRSLSTSNPALVVNGNTEFCNSGTVNLSYDAPDLSGLGGPGDTPTTSWWRYQVSTGWTEQSENIIEGQVNTLTRTAVDGDLYEVRITYSCETLVSNRKEVIVSSDVAPDLLSEVGGPYFEQHSGNITAVGNTETIEYWETSTSDQGWINAGNAGNNTFTYTVDEPTAFRYVVERPGCGSVASTSRFVDIIHEGFSGYLTGPDEVTGTVNSGTLQLVGHSGMVVQWQYSSADASGNRVITDIANTGTSQAFSNLGSDRYYRAEVKYKGNVAHTEWKHIRFRKALATSVVEDNYVRTVSIREPVTDAQQLATSEQTESFSYFDGLGRSVQSVVKGITPSGNDVIAFSEYDELGRMERSYLPHTSSGSDYYPNALQDQQNFYLNPPETIEGSAYPYSTVVYDSSVSGRVLETYAPGEAWQNHPVSFDYDFNTAAEVMHFRVDLSSGDLVQNGFYDAGELALNTVMDEHAHRSMQYTDKSGRLVMKAVEADTGTFAKTYYVYNALGNLRYTLSPEAIKAVEAGENLQSVVDRYAFQYTYDGRRRVIERKEPGAEPVYLIYDGRNRLVLTQDGLQRNRGEWLFTKYDALNRPVSTGTYHDSDDRATVQQKVNDYHNRKKIIWAEQSGITETGGLITKTGANGWDAGAASEIMIESGEDGIVEVIATETTTNRMFGLSAESPSHHYNTIDYAIYLRNNTQIQVYESGTLTGGFGNYETGDILTVRRTGNAITYEKNRSVFYTSTISSTGSLLADLSLHTTGATLQISNPSWYEEKGGTHFDYTNQSFPNHISMQDYLSINYYDNYDFHHAAQLDYQFEPTEEQNEYFDRVKTLVTGGMTRVLGTEQWLRYITYYDDRYRPIQSVSDNHRGGMDRTSNTYDFVGNLLNTSTNHHSPEPLLWKNDQYIQHDNGKYTNIRSGYYGMSSINTLPEGRDGYVEITVTGSSDNRAFIGFGTEDNSEGHTEMDYYVFLENSNLKPYRQGTYEGTALPIEDGDIIRLSRESDTVKIYQNGEEIYRYSTLSTAQYIIDMSIWQHSQIAHIQSSFKLPVTTEAPYPVLTDALLYVENQDGTYTKTANGWNGNISSLNRLKAGESGWFEFETLTNDKIQMIGLSEKDFNSGYNLINHTLYLRNNGAINIYEKGSSKGAFGTYQVGDIFRIERVGQEVRYLQNGTLLYTSAVPSTTDLIVDASLNSIGASITDLKSSFSFEYGTEEDIEITQSYDYDHADRLINSWHEVQQAPEWETLVNIETEDGEIRREDPQTIANAASSVVLEHDEDGSVTYTAEDLNNAKRIGFEFDGTTTRYHMQFYSNTNIIAVRRGGQFNSSFRYSIGDELSIEKKGSNYIFYQNGIAKDTLVRATEEKVRIWIELGEAESVINGLRFGKKILLAHNTYNELGERIEKNLHATADPQENPGYAQSVDYRYNIRGWLKSINNASRSTAANNSDTNQQADYWGMELAYEDTLAGVNSTAAYNGNISATKWSDVISSEQKGYAYAYDPMNRLTGADYHQSGLDVSHFDLSSISYDLNGNITQLSRNDKTGTPLDQLTYDYGTGTQKSNQLQSVSDGGNTEAGFRDGNTSGADYSYDDNGNMTAERNKDIQQISYNHLNLPKRVEKTSGELILYTYDAAGTKLRQEVMELVSEYQSDFSTLDGWSGSRLNRAANIDGIGGEDDVLRLYTSNSNGTEHRVNRAISDLLGHKALLTAKIYIPSGNTNVDGVQMRVGDHYDNNIITTQDQWVEAEFMMNDSSNLSSTIYFYPTSGGNLNFQGANLNSDDLFYIKDVEVKLLKTTKTTDYSGAFVYENDQLQFIHTAEGRVVLNAPSEGGPGGGVEYQYALRDHLGNTRLMFTADPGTTTTTATMEPGNTSEQNHFINMENNLPMEAANVTAGGTYAARVNSANPIGPGTMIKVYPGDTIEMSTYAYYEGGSGYSSPQAMGDFVGALVNSFDPVVAGGEAASQLLSSFNAAVGVFGVVGSNNDDVPGGYLNYVFMDKNLNFDANGPHPLGFEQITDAADFDTAKVIIPPLTIEKEGYIFVYVSNESNTPNYVHFDELTVTVKESPIVQATDYYPFGMASTSMNATDRTINNRYLYNAGSEYNEKTDWYETPFRQYDPAIGRFTAIDALASSFSSWTPYQYAFNDPVYYNDPTGLRPDGGESLLRDGGPSPGNDAGNQSFGSGFGPNGPHSNGIFGVNGIHGSDYSNPYSPGSAAYLGHQAALLDLAIAGSETAVKSLGGQVIYNANDSEQGDVLIDFSSGQFKVFDFEIFDIGGGKLRPWWKSRKLGKVDRKANILRIFSLDQARRIMRAENDGAALDIALYALQNEFVDDEGNPSDYLERVFQETFPNSSIRFPSNGKSADMLFGRNNNIQIQGLNFETGQFENLRLIEVTTMQDKRDAASKIIFEFIVDEVIGRVFRLPPIFWPPYFEDPEIPEG